MVTSIVGNLKPLIRLSPTRVVEVSKVVCVFIGFITIFFIAEESIAGFIEKDICEQYIFFEDSSF